MNLNTFFEQHELMFYTLRALALAGAMLAFAGALIGWRRASVRDVRHLQEQLEQSRSQMQILSDATLQMAGQIEALQTHMENRQQLVAANVAGAQRGYELAVTMARNGAGPNELVSASGVTRQEAALLARLHNPARAA